MALDTALLALMPRTMTVYAPSTATSAYGVPGFSTAAQTLRARVTPVTEQVTGLDGVTREASHVAWLASTGTLPEVTAAWRFSSSRLPSKVVPLKVERPDDDEGGHHIKVWFGVRR